MVWGSRTHPGASRPSRCAVPGASRQTRRAVGAAAAAVAVRRWLRAWLKRVGKKACGGGNGSSSAHFAWNYIGLFCHKSRRDGRYLLRHMMKEIHIWNKNLIFIFFSKNLIFIFYVCILILTPISMKSFPFYFYQQQQKT